MKSAPKHAAPRAARYPRGGRHRRRQPFRPSFALKATAAGMFLAVGSLSTMAASAAPTASSATPTASASADATTTTTSPTTTSTTSQTSTSTTSPSTASADATTTKPPSGTTTTTAPSVHTTATTTAPVAAAAPDPTIVVHAGGVRAGNTTTINPLPDGAVFTATAVGNPVIATGTCTTSGGTGTCSITGLPAGRQWDVTETTPPPGYYLNPNLDSGSSSVETTFPYAFRTATLTGTTTVDVPGPANLPNNTFPSPPPPATATQTFSQQLATSLNDPPGVVRCGLNLALVLDQSGSMAGTKQTNFKAAANEAITDLTGTPSTVAIYTFGQTTGVNIAKTSTVNATSAAPLHTFITNLPAPAGGTNWDQGLAQVAPGFDEVIFLTDGAPTGSRIRTNNFGVSLFTDTEQGIFSANGIKAGGERIVGVGIGLNGGLDNLRAVSGPTLNSDYFNSSSSDFGTILQMLATGACNSQLTITKQIQNSSGALISPTPADANGWTFANTISSGTVASPVTTAAVNGANGVAPAAVTVDAGATPTVTVTETPKAGYTFVTAQCSVGGTNVTTTLNGTTASFTGAADQPMACTFTNRRSGTTATATVIKNAAGSTTVTGALPLGSSVFDTSTVTPTPTGVTPTGSVAYTFFPDNDCSGTGTPAGGGALTLGVPPNSNTQGPLAAGSYSFRAVFTSSDTNFTGSTSACEPLTINAGTTATATAIMNAAGNAPVTGPLPLGSSVFDTSTVTPTPTATFTPRGSVAYTFFPDNDCSGTGTPAGGGALTLGVPPNSNTQGPLAAGSYSFRAVFTSSDTNFTGSTSACEPLTINAGTTATATAIMNAAGNAPVTGPLPLGSSVFDTSTATPTPTATFTPRGSVAYTFFPDNDCSGTGTPAGGGALTLGVPPNSNTQGPLAAGSYSFRAVFTSSDTNFTGSTSACEPLTINAGTTATATAIMNAAGNAPVTGPLPLGSSVFDTSTVTPTPTATFTPRGSVAYTFFSNGTCAGTGTPAGGGALASGVPPNSDTQGPLAAGSYSFRAVFTSGDTNFTGSTSACEPLTINAGTTATATVIENAAGTIVTGALPLGSSVVDTSTVTPTPATPFTPTGSVAYTFFSNGTCAGTGTPAGGGALASGVPPNSDTQGPLAAGSYSFRAVFTPGDPNFTGSTSACEPLTINAGRTTTATVIENAAGTTVTGALPLGSSVVDTSTVTPDPATTPFTPTGSVAYTFFPNGTCSGTGTPAGGGALASGVPPNSSTQGPLAAGSYSFRAVFTSGDTNFTGSTSACEPLTINAGTTATATVIEDAADGTTVTGTLPAGSTVVDTSTVTPTPATPFTPTGSVAYTFFSNGTCSGTGTPAGGGALGSGVPPDSSTQGPLAVGSYSFRAVFTSGDANFTGSTSACEPLTIAQATPTIATTSSAGAVIGISISDTATVTGGFNPTGTVTFNLFDPTSPDCTGDPVSTSTSALVEGSATSESFATAAVGTYQWVATYNGDDNNTAVSSACGDEPVVIAQATPTIATTPSAGGEDGTSISDAATVSGGFNPSGTVTFDLFAPTSEDCTGDPVLTSTNALVEGSATSDSFATTAVGTYQWVATYNGDDNNTAVSSACGDEPVVIGQATTSIATQINMAGTTTAITSPIPLDSSVFDTATITHAHAITPTGTVTYTFYNNGDCTGSGTGAGTVTLDETGSVPNSDTQGPLAAGSHSFQATYSGDADFIGSTSPCEPLTVEKGSSNTATTVFDAATKGAWAGTEVTGTKAYDTAKVSHSGGATATGTVTYTFYSGANCTGTTTSAGTVTLTANGTVPNSDTQGPLAAGSHSFQAAYSGDTNYSPSTSGCEPFSVDPASPAGPAPITPVIVPVTG